MNLGKTIWGVGLLAVDNLIYSFLYPFFTAFMNSISNLGADLSASSSQITLYWGMFLVSYAVLCWILPVWLIISGMQES